MTQLCQVCIDFKPFVSAGFSHADAKNMPLLLRFFEIDVDYVHIFPYEQILTNY
jgi:hypothetical protein